jgi:hypothetical protein
LGLSVSPYATNELISESYWSDALIAKAHVSRVLEKLELNNRVQIALLAHDAGEAEPPQPSIAGAAPYSSSLTGSPHVAGLPWSSTSTIAMWVMNRVGGAPCQ